MRSDVPVFLQKKYSEAVDKYGEPFRDTAHFCRERGVQLSAQAVTAVLNRGVCKGISVNLQLAYHLGCSSDEMAWVANQMGEPVLAKIVCQPVVSYEEETLLNAFRLLNGEQKATLLNVAKGLKS